MGLSTAKVTSRVRGINFSKREIGMKKNEKTINENEGVYIHSKATSAGSGISGIVVNVITGIRS